MAARVAPEELERGFVRFLDDCEPYDDAFVQPLEELEQPLCLATASLFAQRCGGELRRRLDFQRARVTQVCATSSQRKGLEFQSFEESFLFKMKVSQVFLSR